jgi:hypothetical protein
LQHGFCGLQFYSFIYLATLKICGMGAPSSLLSHESCAARPCWLQVQYAEAACADYVQAAAEAAVAIHKADMPGDILVFLTGQQARALMNATCKILQI